MASVGSRRKRAKLNWSGQSSGAGEELVRPEALQLTRKYLRETGNETARGLASSSDAELLQRLGAFGDDGLLTNAARLLFAGNGHSVIEYRFRGGHKELRPDGELSALEQLTLVLDAVRDNNPEVQMPDRVEERTVPALSELAAREAVVNGVVHRDWVATHATEVEQEHRFGALRVRSPGGFVRGFGEYNIFSRSPFPRNPELMKLLEPLGLVENRGAGVGRMVTELIGNGQPAPTFREVEDSSVEVLLGGRPPDPAWRFWITELGWPRELEDHRLLLPLDRRQDRSQDHPHPGAPGRPPAEEAENHRGFRGAAARPGHRCSSREPRGVDSVPARPGRDDGVVRPAEARHAGTRPADRGAQLRAVAGQVVHHGAGIDSRDISGGGDPADPETGTNRGGAARVGPPEGPRIPLRLERSGFRRRMKP